MVDASSVPLAPSDLRAAPNLPGTFPAFAGLAIARLSLREPAAAARSAGPQMISATIGDAGALGSRAARVHSLYPVRACLRDGTAITIRPIGPEDAQREQAFVQALSLESRYFRFMSTLRELSPETLYRFTHPDFDREVALVALCEEAGGVRQIGVARCIVQGEARSAEFAIVVADDWQTRGVGNRLMCELMRAARAAGITRIWGDVLASNHRMLALMHALGFDIASVPEDALLRRVVRNIEAEPAGQKDFVHAT